MTSSFQLLRTINLHQAKRSLNGGTQTDFENKNYRSPPIMKKVKRSLDEGTQAVFAKGTEISSPKGNIYIVQELMGRGVFGTAYQVLNKQNKQTCVMKIFDRTLDATENTQDAQQEVENISRIKKLPKNKQKYFLDYYEVFNDKKGFPIIVMEKLDVTLEQYVDFVNGSTSVEFVQDIGRQLLEGLAALNSVGLVHTDIKLDNVMFVNRSGKKPNQIKIIDLGNAYTKQVLKEHSEIAIMPLIFKAPEELFGLPRDDRIDIWMTGHVMFELYTGNYLFYLEDENTHALASQINDIFGLPVDIEDGIYTNYYLKVNEETNQYDWVDEDAAWAYSSWYKETGFNNLPRYGKNYETSGKISSLDSKFAYLMNEVMNVNAQQRPTAEQALKNQFFQ